MSQRSRQRGAAEGLASIGLSAVAARPGSYAQCHKRKLAHRPTCNNLWIILPVAKNEQIKGVWLRGGVQWNKSA